MIKQNKYFPLKRVEGYRLIFEITKYNKRGNVMSPINDVTNMLVGSMNINILYAFIRNKWIRIKMKNISGSVYKLVVF